MNRADAKSVLIFALSADAFVEDERRSIESGMNGHYAKPVDFTALQHNIGVFLREKEKKWIWGRPLGREVCLFCKVVQKSGKKS